MKYDKSQTVNRTVSGSYIRQNYLNAVIKVKGENLSKNKDVFKFKHENKTVYMQIEHAVDDDGFDICQPKFTTKNDRSTNAQLLPSALLLPNQCMQFLFLKLHN